MLEQIKNIIGLNDDSINYCKNIIDNLIKENKICNKEDERLSIMTNTEMYYKNFLGECKKYTSYAIIDKKNPHFLCLSSKDSYGADLYKFETEINESLYTITINKNKTYEQLHKDNKPIILKFNFEDKHVSFEKESGTVIIEDSNNKIKIPFRDGHLIFGESSDQYGRRLNTEESYKKSKEIFMNIIKNIYLNRNCGLEYDLDNLVMVFSTPLDKQNNIYLGLQFLENILDKSTKENLINSIRDKIDENSGFINMIINNKNHNHAMAATIFKDENNEYKMMIFDSSNACGNAIAGIYDDMDNSFKNVPILNRLNLQYGGSCGYFAALAASELACKNLTEIKNLYNNYSSYSILKANTKELVDEYVKEKKFFEKLLYEFNIAKNTGNSEELEELNKEGPKQYCKFSSCEESLKNEAMKKNSSYIQNYNFDEDIANKTLDFFYELVEQPAPRTNTDQNTIDSYIEHQNRLKIAKLRLEAVNDQKYNKFLSKDAKEIIIINNIKNLPEKDVLRYLN